MKTRAISLTLLALLLAQPAGAVSYPITISYGRSWPLSVVADPARGMVYIDATSGEYPPAGFSFGLINASSHAVTRVLPLNESAGAMAIDLSSGDVFVAGSNSLQVFDRINGSLGRLIPLDQPAIEIAYDWHVSRNVFVTSADAVLAVNPRTGAVMASAHVNGGAGIALDPGSDRLYVAEYLSAAIAVFQASNLAPAASIKLPTCCAAQLALDSKRHMLYASTETNNVDVVDVGAGTFVRSVQAAPSSQNSTKAIVVDNATGRVFVSSSPGGSILEIDGSRGTVVGDFRASYEVAGMALDARTGELFATNYHQVTVFSTERSHAFLLLLAGGAVLVAVVLVALFVVLRRRDARERARIQSGWQGRAPPLTRRL